MASKAPAEPSAPPDDFGLTPVRTLAHVGDPRPAAEHSVFWRHFKRTLHLARPTLNQRRPGGTGTAQPDPSDPTATHAFESVPLLSGSHTGTDPDAGPEPAHDADPDLMHADTVRIGARLLMPPEGVETRAGLVTTHGYAASKPLAERDALFDACRAAGVAVLHVRVRGFPGSRLDTGDLTRPFDPRGDGSLGWICRGLDDPADTPEAVMRWVYPQAVADVVNAARALRWRLERETGRTPDVFLHGESFGGGLAVAAAAVLSGREARRTDLARLVLALPTMGDWPWRLSAPGRVGRGTGDEIARLIARSPTPADRIMARLRVCDSVVLARRVRCPVLCKLATRDEVVPAPTAAAIYNAVASDPSRRWRFVVPHGHAETGVPNARRHAAFDRLANAFLDPRAQPEATMDAWDDDRDDREHAEGTPDPAAQLGLFAGEDGDTPHAADAPAELSDDERRLADAYAAVARTLDDLPYTPEFERLHDEIGGDEASDRAGLFRRLHTLRKAGKLPRLGPAAGKAVKLGPAEQAALARLVEDAVGSLSKRDRLPYTPGFDRLVERFVSETGRDLDPHAVWRAVATLAK